MRSDRHQGDTGGRGGASGAVPRTAAASLLAWGGLWAVAFGVVEGAVVVYLRALLYPQGFALPLAPLDPALLATETVREAATLVMILGVACLATRGGLRRFAVFAWCFGVWDLAYYAMLAATLGWPDSLLAWDVLFLIPLPWLGPVLAPVLVSLALMAAAALVLHADDRGRTPRLRASDWALEVAAGLAILASFLWNTPAVREGRAPASFPWWLFLAGWFGGCAWFVRCWLRRDDGASTRS